MISYVYRVTVHLTSSYHISGWKTRDIHSFVAYIRQIDPVEPIPSPAWATAYVQLWRLILVTDTWLFIILEESYILAAPSISSLHWLNTWRFIHPFIGFVFNPAQCLVTFLTRKAWHWYSHLWPDQVLIQVASLAITDIFLVLFSVLIFACFFSFQISECEFIWFLE